MKLLDRTLVNLASRLNPDLLGHISLYELTSGNHYYVYFVEERYYAAKEVDVKTGKTIKEESSDSDYHYSIDLFFNDKKRYLGWQKTFGQDFMKQGYSSILMK